MARKMTNGAAVITLIQAVVSRTRRTSQAYSKTEAARVPKAIEALSDVISNEDKEVLTKLVS